MGLTVENGQRLNLVNTTVRQLGDAASLERVRDLVLQAYAEYEERAAIAATS